MDESANFRNIVWFLHCFFAVVHVFVVSVVGGLHLLEVGLANLSFVFLQAVLVVNVHGVRVRCRLLVRGVSCFARGACIDLLKKSQVVPPTVVVADEMRDELRMDVAPMPMVTALAFPSLTACTSAAAPA